ncbi:MAG: class I SAM-dependent methyltransferase, partial [Anaerohalosphaera sp.]|nr:class I SAM-dependent methyltransferase [Anaerohalosphaera sp.]
MTKGRIGRVKDAWKDSNKKRGSTWWMIPEIGQRINKCMTGEESTDYYTYVSEKYLSGKKQLVGLSLGCGTGHREPKWAGLGDFQRIDAYDISDNSIKTAKKQAEEKGMGNILNYYAADIHKLDLPANEYDVVFIEHSLHHFSPLKSVLENVNKWLKPDGVFIVNEFVGPTRFQWTKKQIDAANHARSLLPEKYRAHIVDGAVNRIIFRPSRMSMLAKDPSEAIESAMIMPLLKECLTVAEYKPCYGAMLHLLFEGIAQNFMPMDDEARRYFNMCLEIEDCLTE